MKHYRPIISAALAVVAVLTASAIGQVAAADVITTTFSDGSHRVGIDIAPGTYFAEFEDGICALSITDTDGAQRTPTFRARAIVTITESDTLVQTRGCGEWNPRETRRPPLREFGEGLYDFFV
ncbi:MAG: hypothetical protein F4180_03175 [Chloroflexi bacterium]|nr:hypothetical protein [Chloroflexota bacterium]